MIHFNRFIRCFLWGFCPECNSDAPKLYDCKVCHYYTSGTQGKATSVTKAKWWLNYVKLHS